MAAILPSGATNEKFGPAGEPTTEHAERGVDHEEVRSPHRGIRVVVLAGTASADTNASNLPFRVSGSGSIFQSGPSGSLSGTVHGLHIGAGSFSGNVFTGSYPPPCDEGGIGNGGSTQLTAANGDILYTEFSQSVCQSGSTQTYEGTGTYTIDGGTGRFENATGSGTETAEAVFPDGSPFGEGTWKFAENGTISLNPAGKS